jgi:hypothetical protein
MPKQSAKRKPTMASTNPVKSQVGPGYANNDGATGDLANIKREFILTQSADDALHELMRVVSRSTSTNLTNSHLFRVLLKVVEHAMPEIEKEFSQVGKLKRPSNARGRESERDEFERMLASALVAALRDCDPL